MMGEASPMSIDPNDRLQDLATHILRSGPNRVVVDEHGHTVTPLVARRQYGRSRFDVIFIRQDGWSLGATNDLAAVAEAQWRDHWIGVLRPPALRADPYVRSEA